MAFLLASLLVLAASPQEAGRYRSPEDYWKGEVVRKPNDILEAARRPRMAGLGRDAIRFSSNPSFSGLATIVELVAAPEGDPKGKVFWLRGDTRRGWRVAGTLSFEVHRSSYRQLVEAVDAGLRPRKSFPETEVEGELHVTLCGDGPGYLTERISGKHVASLAGSCGDDHPNDRIAAQVVSLLRDEIGIGFGIYPEDYGLR